MASTFTNRARAICGAAAILLVVGGVAGCLDGPAEDPTVSVSLKGFKSQLGYGTGGSTSQVTAPAADDPDNPATSVARSLVVGAVVIRSRTLAEGPYDEQTPITPEVQDDLEADIRNSASFLTLTNLPTVEDTVSINLPPVSASKWQLMGAALSTQPATKEALGNDENQDATIYIGFAQRFLSTSIDGQIYPVSTTAGEVATEPIETLSIVMRRACLVNSSNPPKGCAQFNDDGSSVVTSAVEILSVELDGEEVAVAGLPLIVREEPDEDAGEVSVADAKAALAEVLSATNVAEHTSVEVFTTHQLGPDQSEECAAATTVTDLRDLCGEQTYYTPL